MQMILIPSTHRLRGAGSHPWYRITRPRRETRSETVGPTDGARGVGRLAHHGDGLIRPLAAPQPQPVHMASPAAMPGHPQSWNPFTTANIRQGAAQTNSVGGPR
ncbi:hypothetical protein GCM10011588_25300 [Nocardia jinanensis]|uniref:Uncharacterized protein n=1 Tax=Nocardia jinanensis TaxID=382504 RepID=A0A917VR83_9NOCA|nr:hypothetical protein GCM10011588_25300 [Nocardia jinanensis]